MLLFMMASGLTLIFSMMGVLNFAHARFYMLGVISASSRSPYRRPGFIAAPLTVGAIGAVVERYGLRRVHKLGQVSELLFTFGLAFVIEELVQMFWGKLPLTPGAAFARFRCLPSVRHDLSRLSHVHADDGDRDVRVPSSRAVHTRVGLIVQAALTHPNMVSMLGHDSRVFSVVFGVGATMAGLAGDIAGSALVTQPSMAAMLGPILFVVIVVGGLGSLTGAFVASLLIGLVDFRGCDEFLPCGFCRMSAPPYLSDLSQVTVSTRPVIPYLMLVLILIFRPTGLMGTRES